MGKTLIKYFGTGFSVLFLSMTDVGDGSKIKIGPIVLNPDNIVKPFKEAYNNITNQKRSKKSWITKLKGK
tara:strand:+ start:900 stop:1109 length:210 start_codon:yes stop_codon:yes gene_type:complete